MHKAIRLGVVASGFCSAGDMSNTTSSCSMLASMIPNKMHSILTRPFILKSIASFKSLQQFHVVFDRCSNSSTWRVPNIATIPGGLKELEKLKCLAVSVVSSQWPCMPAIRKTNASSLPSRWKETSEPLDFLNKNFPRMPSLEALRLSLSPPNPGPVLDFIQGLGFTQLRCLSLEMASAKVVVEITCIVLERCLCPGLEILTLRHTLLAEGTVGPVIQRLLKMLLQDAALPSVKR